MQKKKKKNCNKYKIVAVVKNYTTLQEKHICRRYKLHDAD